MPTFNKFNCFVENCAEKVHNLGSDTIKVALTNSAPSSSNSTLSDITEVAYTYCSSRTVTISSSSQTGGTYSLVATDLTLTASGGPVGPFRYIVLYNDTPTSPADPLIGYYDYSSSITLADTEALLIDFGSSVFTLA
jgi:hypothetical protein